MAYTKIDILNGTKTVSGSHEREHPIENDRL